MGLLIQCCLWRSITDIAFSIQYFILAINTCVTVGSDMLKIMHYENTPMQYTAIFHGCKNDNFQLKFFDYFHIFAQNIYCGYTLEPPH